MGVLAQTMYDPIRAANNTTPPDWVLNWSIASPVNDFWVDDPGDSNEGPNVLFLEGVNISGEGVLASWNRFNEPEHESDDTDMLILFRYVETPTTQDNFLVVCRGGGTQNNEDGYMLRDAAVSDTWEIIEFTAGSETILATFSPITMVLDTWYWVQFQVIGDQIKARIWEHGTANPFLWQSEITDGTHTVAGLLGFGSAHALDIEVDFISIGTDGDFSPLPAGVIVSQPGLIATPIRIHADGSSLLVFTGEPNKTVDWAITAGDGSLNVITNQTDNQGQASATYTPGTPDTFATIEVTYGGS